MADDGDRRRGEHHADDASWGDRLRRLTRLRGGSRMVLIGAVALGVLSSTGVAVASAVGGSSSRRPQAVTAAPRLPRGARAIGSLSAGSQVTGAVALRLPDPTAVQRFLTAVSNPRSPLYHHYLAPGQFTQRFGPRADTVAAVQRQLKSDGLTVTHVSANRMLVSFSGAASRVESAFGTGLERVRLANGTTGRATTGAIKVPAAVAPQVAAVLGLDQLVHNHSEIRRRTRVGTHATPAAAQPHTDGTGPSACSDAQGTVSDGGLTDQQVATSYGLDPLYSAGDTGAGQTVDIFEEEPYDPSDISAFDECYFGTDTSASNLTDTLVDGGAGTGPGVGEAALDVENISALAPAAHIHVFTGPLTNLGGTDVWNAIAVADDAKQISTSWGLCETAVQEGAPGQQQVESEIFEQIAAQGQSVFSAAGDAGSDDCAGQASSPVAPDLSVDDPSSQPYVTAVGGTTMVNATDPPTETVWNNGPAGGGGGGGISETWAMPSWQTATAVSQSAAEQVCSNDLSGTADNYHLAGYPTTLSSGTACRELPDVSAVADPQTGMTIYWSGSWTIIGGTSSAAPIWAAILADINASRYCAKPVGFVSPLLYQIASSSPANYDDAFNDITSGNNDSLGVGSGTQYPAGTGYDMATGLGTPRVTDPSGSPGLAQQLCAAAAGDTSGTAPQVTGINPSSGPTAGGTQVTITGSNFGSSGAVYFDSMRATVVTWTPSAVTADTPAYTPPPGTSASAPGRALVTVVPNGSTSSAPSGKSVFDYTATASTGTPVVDYISTPYGPNAGGNVVDIVGANLAANSTVMFGNEAATVDGLAGPATNAQDELQVTVPKLATDQTCGNGGEPATGICAVQVTVSNGEGTSSGPTPLPAYTGPIVFSADGSFAAPTDCGCEVVPQSDEYDYAAAPQITSVSPAYMDEGGTSTATITGSNFNLLTYEWTNIGDPSQEANQDFELEGISADTVTVGVLADPNSTTGPDPWPLTVLSAGQLSNSHTIDYAGTPELDSISKTIASQSDPGTLTITGQGLQQVNRVKFEDQSDTIGPAIVTSFISQTATQLKLVIPSYFAIPVDVMVCSVTGCSAPDPSIDGLTYAYPGRPVLTSASPASGSSAGGTLVTLNGTLDSNIIAVHFGSRAANIDSDTFSEPFASPSGQVTVSAPPGTPNSKVNITISTDGGELVGSPTSAVTSRATFTYGPPVPTGAFRLSAPKISKTGTLSFHLRVQQAGRFTARALTSVRRQGKSRRITFGKTSRKVSRAGFTTLVIKPSKAARAALAQGKKLSVRVTVTFAPHRGSAVTHHRAVSVRRRT